MLRGCSPLRRFFAARLAGRGSQGGCASVFAEDGTSASLGTTADGALRAPVMLPVSGDGYIVPSHWRPRNSNYGTEELVGLVARSTRVGRRA